jgi:hypothetical protein
LQYAGKENPEQETYLAQFEIDRCIEYISNLGFKMGNENRAMLDRHTAALNALSKDIRQRILLLLLLLLLQAFGKISTYLALQYLP